jgi:hypothetical protein
MTILILAPEYFGGLRLYVRTGRGPLRQGPIAGLPADVRACLLDLPAPRVVILCGRRFADELSDAVLDLADLFVVPNTWLRGLPKIEPGERALQAARLAVAHAQAPIEHRLSRHCDGPF